MFYKKFEPSMEQHIVSPLGINHVLYSTLFTKEFDKWYRIVEGGGFDLVVLDFDKTMTTSESATPWCLFDRSTFASEKTRETMSRLYEKHCPVETSHLSTAEEKLQNADEWYKGTFESLSVELHNTQRLQEAFSFIHPYGKVEQDDNFTKDYAVVLKHSLVDFLRELNRLNVPCLVFSAGLGDMIDHVLRQYDDDAFGVQIVSNFMMFDFEGSDVPITYASHVYGDREKTVHVFENAKANGWTRPTIHCANKNMSTLERWLESNVRNVNIDPDLLPKIKNAKRVLLVGDMLSDAHMSDGLRDDADIVKICFHEKKFNQHKETIKELGLFYDQEMLEHATTLSAKQRKPLKDRSLPLFKRFDIQGIANIDTTQTPVFDMMILGDHDYTFLEDFELKKDAFDIVIHNCKHATFDVICALFRASVTHHDHTMKKPTNPHSYFSKNGFCTFDIISVSGFARNGKSTFGEYVEKKLSKNKTKCVAFADKLRFVANIVDPAIPVDASERMELFRSTNGVIDDGKNIENYNILVKMFGYEQSKTIVKSFRRALIAIGEGFRNDIDAHFWINWLFQNDLKIIKTTRCRHFPAPLVDDVRSFVKDWLKNFFTLIGYEKRFLNSFHETGAIEWDDYYRLNLEPQRVRETFTNYLRVANLLVPDFDMFLDRLNEEIKEAITCGESYITYIDTIKDGNIVKKIDASILFESLEDVFDGIVYDESLIGTQRLDDCIKTLFMDTTTRDKRSTMILNILSSCIDTMQSESNNVNIDALCVDGDDDKNIIITDARYHNERIHGFKRGALLVYVYNPTLKNEPPVTEIASYDDDYYHVNLRNDGDMSSYEKMIEETLCLQRMCLTCVGSKIIVDLRGSDFQ